MKILFPYDNIRPEQAKLMKDVEQVLTEKKNLIAHAPTGLGKTASVLSVAVPFAIENNLTVFFLTNRHTQHKIAVDTLAEIKTKHNVKIVVADIIGKKWMCLQENVDSLINSEFMEYCKSVRENDKCEFYQRLYKTSSQLSVIGKKTKEELISRSPMHVDDVKSVCNSCGVCPYYLTSEFAKSAQVIVADYYNIFHPSVQQAFFSRVGKHIEESIIIVDEGHNLGERIRKVMSKKLSSFMIKNAVYEAKKFGYVEIIVLLQELQNVLNGLIKKSSEVLVRKEDFMSKLGGAAEYEDLISKFNVIGEHIREINKRSFIGNIGDFLEEWKRKDTGFMRYIEEKNSNYGPITTLNFSCLDAALVSSSIFDRAYSSIIMSGTLTPTSMFKDVLGVQRTLECLYAHPFSQDKRLVLVIPKTTTKFTLRGKDMFKQIAKVCGDIVESVPGNSAFYFPSYYLRDSIVEFFNCSKPLFIEKSSMNSDDKVKMLDEFKSCKNKGAVLLGVAAANFSEGVDLPGDYLKAVVVVGLPLAKPDLKIKALIDYYDKKYGCGWDYGYVYPAMTKCLQAAGRCIRTETDKGVIVFLDERFIQLKYFQCIPPDFDAKVTNSFVEKISLFFK